jgi:hypothetical protein
LSDQRRLVAGLRHVPTPRDLGARVRGGIESGRRVELPWWRRPGGLLAAAASVATVAAAVLLAVFVFKPGPSPVASASQTQSASAFASEAPSPSVEPSATPLPSSTPTVTATPVPSSPPISADPVGHLVFRLVDGAIDFSFVTPTEEIALKLPSAGMPAAASLSPDGGYLALRLDGETSGLSQYWLVNLSNNELTKLGDSLPPPYGFGDEMAWSHDTLAYTLFSPDSAANDVWVYRVGQDGPKQLTNTGDAFAASFMPSTEGDHLWISRAGETPTSYLVALPNLAAFPEPSDPASGALATFSGVFEPLVSPDGKHVIFWRGAMGTAGGHWSFATGGMPYLDSTSGDGPLDFEGAQQLFSTLTAGREAFKGARIAWSPNSDAFAVWDALWTGIPQGSGFPDQARIYLGHVANAELITAAQALDPADTKDARAIVDVALAGDGDHLALTLLMVPGAEGGAYGPTAELRMVTRGYGTDPDRVEAVGQEKVWTGPAVYAGNPG